MFPNIFGGCILGPSASQLRHKQQKNDRENRGDTAPPTPALNAQLLPSLNGGLMSLISHNSQGKMVVWYDFCRKYFEMLFGAISIHHRCAFTTVFFIFLPSRCVINEKKEDLSRHQNEPIIGQHSPYK